MRPYRLLVILLLALTALGCEVLPERRLRPTLRNPFPQMTEVAVVPFFDRTKQQNINRTEFAQAYANELQKVSGFNVRAVRDVEEVMLAAGISKLENADDIRYLCRLLGVEAIVIGYVNEFSAYYPPKCSLKVEWYAANPYFQAVPNGANLPWGTMAEREIPAKVVDMAQHDLARVQLATQTPNDPNADYDYDELMREYLFDQFVREKASELGIRPEELRARLRGENPQATRQNADFDADENGNFGQSMQKTDYQLRQDAFLKEKFERIGVPKGDEPDYFDEDKFQRLMNESQESTPEISAWGLRNRAEDGLKSMTPQNSKNNKFRPNQTKPETESPAKPPEAPMPPAVETPLGNGNGNAPENNGSELPEDWFGSRDNPANIWNKYSNEFDTENNDSPFIIPDPREIKQLYNSDDSRDSDPGFVIPENFSSNGARSNRNNYRGQAVANSQLPPGYAYAPLPAGSQYENPQQVISPQDYATAQYAAQQLAAQQYAAAQAIAPQYVVQPYPNQQFYGQAMMSQQQQMLLQQQLMQQMAQQQAGNGQNNPQVPMMPLVQQHPPIPMPGMPVDGQNNPRLAYAEPETMPGLPEEWPDARGLIPQGPSQTRPEGRYINNGPVISHSAIYNGDDKEFTQSLADYDFLFRDDRRVVSWQSILNNRSEFISFCCRVHIWETFGARGGAGKAEKVWQLWKPWEGGERPY